MKRVGKRHTVVYTGTTWRYLYYSVRCLKHVDSASKYSKNHDLTTLFHDSPHVKRVSLIHPPSSVVSLSECRHMLGNYLTP